MADNYVVIRLARSISSISRSSNVVSVTVSSSWHNSNLKVGQRIVIYGVTTSSFNDTVVIDSVTDQSNFTYLQAGSDESDTDGNAGGHWDTLSDWENYDARDLTSTSEVENVECYNDWASGLSDSLTTSGFTTSPTYKINIYAPESERHDGTPDTGFKLSLGSGEFNHRTHNVSLIGLHVTGSALNQRIGAFGACENLILDKCIFQGTSSNYTCFGIYPGNYASSVIVRNSLLLDFGGSGIYWAVNSPTIEIENCTIINCNRYNSENHGGVRLSGAGASVKNTVCEGNSYKDFHTVNSGDYLASGDTSANVVTNYVTGIVSGDFADYANDDYHLSGASSALHGVGESLTSDFTDDIDGDTRPSSGAWSIGFDEVVSGGGGTTTMDAAYASFALTGQAADLSRAFILAASHGGYTVTGQSAGLSKAFILSADRGSFSLNGQDAGLFFTLVMPAASAAYTATGFDAELTKGFIMQALTGAFVMSGRDAALLASLILQAAQGDYSLTGSAADFSKAFIMAADTGSFAVSGQIAGLLASRLLTLANGNYSITPNDALLGKVFVITAGSGSYSLSPQDAVLIADRLLSGEYALYELTGQDASFIYSGSPLGEVARISVALKKRTITFSLVANN